MSVRLQSSGIESRGITTPTRVSAPAATGAAPAPAARMVEQAAADNSWYAGFAARQSELNRDATGTQRALAWLDTLLPRLREVARRPGAPPSRAGAAPPAPAARPAAPRPHWARRHLARGRPLHADLH